MKQKDIILIVAIAVFAGIISIIASKLIFVTPANQQQEVEKVDAISTNFTVPSTAYFNASSIDPTQNIQIGNSTNPAPFSTTDGSSSN